MTQMTVNFNISPWHLAGTVIVSTLIYSGVFTDRLKPFIDELFAGAKNFLWDCPIMIFSGGFTYLAHQLILTHTPHLSLSTETTWEGSFKVAAFVVVYFALRAALSTFFQDIVFKRQETTPTGNLKIKDGTDADEMLRKPIINNFVPLAACLMGAYYLAIPLKLTQTAIFTTTLVSMARLTGRGFRAFFADPSVRVPVGEWYSWLDLETPAAKKEEKKDEKKK